MKIICTAKEKEQFIEGVSYDVNESCPIAEIFGNCFDGSCSECANERIQWVVQDSIE